MKMRFISYATRGRAEFNPPAQKCVSCHKRTTKHLDDLEIIQIRRNLAGASYGCVRWRERNNSGVWLEIIDFSLVENSLFPIRGCEDAQVMVSTSMAMDRLIATTVNRTSLR